jgi:alkanesulfonate monooxygenase SsuD/methylene tetrahydromethanopterin reductase-like flavin-dependent oxidoreductase (luciferase family)
LTSLHLAVALDGTGFHPASWRDPSARPTELFTAGYWADLGRTAERGLLDFLTIEDSFGLQSSQLTQLDGRGDQVRGRLEAVLLASYIAPVTTRIGLVPTANTTLTEPFHVASATSTLDYVSGGRAGWRPQASARPAEAAHVGLRTLPPFDPAHVDHPATAALLADIFEEAADAVEVVRRLWDSWEDDAIIKDVATGRYIDRDKLHYVDFEGRFFTVKGPSIVPRPPQGQPVIAALAHSQIVFEFAARAADVVFVTPAERGEVRRWVDDIRLAEHAVARSVAPLKVFADVNVVLDGTSRGAQHRLSLLDALDGAPWKSDAAVLAGTPEELAEELIAWRAEGLDGFRLRPAVIGRDLEAIVDQLVPALQRRGVFRTEYDSGLFRERLGLGRPASRYASTGGGR